MTTEKPATVAVGSDGSGSAPVGRDPQADALAPKHAHPTAIKSLRKLWAVCDPTGHIDHTTLSTRDDESIAAWMKTEQTLIPIFRGKPAQSWEVYEAEGYQVIQCDLTPSSQNNVIRPHSNP